MQFKKRPVIAGTGTRFAVLYKLLTHTVKILKFHHNEMKANIVFG
jgi:hypothetical protein